jgi:hypothetical protein
LRRSWPPRRPLSSTPELPFADHTASLEIQDAKSARDALDNNELCGSGLPGIVGSSAALGGVVEDIQARHLVGGADFAHSSDAPRNEGRHRGSERRCRPAGPGPDDVDLQNEAAGYHSMVTKTWSGYLKGLILELPTDKFLQSLRHVAYLMQQKECNNKESLR